MVNFYVKEFLKAKIENVAHPALFKKKNLKFFQQAERLRTLCFLFNKTNYKTIKT